MANDLELGLIHSIGDEEGLSLLAEIGEFTLDQFLDEGLLKDAPVVGGFFGLLKTGRNIRDYLFARKIASFLVNLDSKNREERNSILDEVERDPDKQRRVGATVLMLLDKQTDLQKSKVLAFVFTEYLNEEISFSQFLRLADCVERCMVVDLMVLPSIYKDNERLGHSHGGLLRFTGSKILERIGSDVDVDDIYRSLVAAGIMEISNIPTIKGDGAENQYVITRLGAKMAGIVDKIDWGDL